MRKIQACKVTRRNEVRWRVIVPALLNGGRRAERYFHDGPTANRFAQALEAERQSQTLALSVLSQVDKATVIRCLERLDNRTELLTQAVDYFLAHKPGLASPRPLKQAIADFVASKRAANRRGRYIAELEWTLGRFLLTREADNVGEITTAEIEQWLNSNDWAPVTRLNYLRRLQVFFGFCLKRGLTATNPTAGIERPAGDNKPPVILTVPEMRRLMEACRETDPALVPYFALCAFGGIRPEEVRRLTWADVRKDHVEVQAAKAKTRRRRLVEINPALRAWLKLGGDLPIVNWRRRFRAVLEAVKPPIAWTPDCLRHSFCSYAMPVFGAAKTAEMAGNSEAMLFAHYRELVTAEAAKAFWGIRPKEKAPLG